MAWRALERKKKMRIGLGRRFAPVPGRCSGGWLRSLWESEVLRFLLDDDGVEWVGIETVRFRYVWKKKRLTHVADFWVALRSGLRLCLEVKPQWSAKQSQNQAKRKACQAQGASEGFEYLFVTEHEIRVMRERGLAEGLSAARRAKVNGGKGFSRGRLKREEKENEAAPGVPG